MKTTTLLLMLALLCGLITLPTLAQTTDDTALVRQIIEAETRAYLEVKPDLIRAFWADKPYVERQHDLLRPYAGGNPYLKGESLFRFGEAFLKSAKNNGHTLRISDYNARLSGNMAWATYTEEELNPAGAVVRKNRNVRILEREPAGWKIVFQSLQKL